MTRILFILFSFLIFTSCDDNDSLFGPPADLQDNIFDHINHFRLINGLSVLEQNSELDMLAKDHAEYMGQNEVVNHDDQSFRYNFAVEELSMSKYAEIVESGNLYGRDLIDKWSDNDAYTAILLFDYQYVGIGVYESDDQSYATIIFTK